MQFRRGKAQFRDSLTGARIDFDRPVEFPFDAKRTSHLIKDVRGRSYVLTKDENNVATIRDLLTGKQTASFPVPSQSEFYPFYSTNDGSALGDNHGRVDHIRCVWTEGGPAYPGTTNNFGGSSATEFGQVAEESWYPGPGFQPIYRWNNYRNILSTNPCTSK